MNTPRSQDDTIIALASGAGRAGVAVVRVSGPGAVGVLTHLGGAPVPEARKAAIRALREDGAYLDEAIILYMPGPNSFTGQDIVEFQVHGGAAVIEAVIGAALRARLCRLADPGEFTRRAFENGRLDLTQA
ncbi:MAG: tRNA uridine-5-carboxymethylaminomethyl(34) synthesis GTPase MnmE, partial [Alphaproteobacteria bacterium]